ncbi:hypothetical protein S-PM2d056 [Synechococcus phage S-PM2]|uniref:Hypothetical-Protein / belonging to T4-LIKE GC: 68 n=1 Tax=Synechococcus phage S-PM2 TaxID=238854 RepID=Q5GQY0_BPSYP|nr:Hypothetical-Protein / belonging to T4-LIKE GC: 68 [Synechococcus phage S-PM2]CAF34120.1 Hypothetical-Protein / belonging to T4-LIKE GC: 68 [Synechococcus phage S-PM2]CFW42165.1 hypothetical protein S-PM2d056 [Synechococcus phage S-PM2]
MGSSGTGTAGTPTAARDPILITSAKHAMTTTFAQFASEQDARNTIHLNIVKYGLMLCDALQQTAPDGYHYSLDSSGRKYHKVFMHIGDRRDSIHAFIDKKTGDVYKPASTKAPAKGVRYNVLSIASREEMFERCDWAGGYLYMR